MIYSIDNWDKEIKNVNVILKGWSNLFQTIFQGRLDHLVLVDQQVNQDHKAKEVLLVHLENVVQLDPLEPLETLVSWI